MRTLAALCALLVFALVVAGSSLAEGVTADFEGNVYGADFLGDVRKFVKK